jgi:hypothetical protein
MIGKHQRDGPLVQDLEPRSSVRCSYNFELIAEGKLEYAEVIGLVIDVENRILAIIHRPACSRSRHSRPANNAARQNVLIRERHSSSRGGPHAPNMRFGCVFEKV